MNDYKIHTKDLNSSLVFYRTLFEKMPDLMNAFEMVFNHDQFKVSVHESLNTNDKEVDPFHFKVEKSQLNEVYDKMKRFTRINRLKEDCERPENAIGLIDPDGYKWIIGEYQEDVSFEKCYTNF